jgi:hypothetical protein
MSENEQESIIYPKKAVFKHLEELNFSFNMVEDEEGLVFPVAQFPRLMLLIVTGNPFALRGDPFATHALENIMNSRTMGSGKIINETLNPPTYLRRQKSRRDGTQNNPLAIGYNNFFQPSSNRDLVVI